MKVILNNVRLTFPDLFEATPFEPGAAPRYSASFIVEKGSENHKKIVDAINAVAADAWKGKAPAMLESLKGNTNKFCYTSGDAKNWSGAEGAMVLASHRKEVDGRPSVVGRNMSPLQAKDGVIYSGCRVNASVDIWAQEGQYVGVRCTLIGVQFFADDTPFGGAPKASADDFADLGDGAAADFEAGAAYDDFA